ncbi:hypothetical protein ABZ172_11965 [Streptomyces sp. NPDC006296]
MPKKKNKAHKRLAAQRKPTEVKALRSLAMADALWGALIREVTDEHR